MSHGEASADPQPGSVRGHRGACDGCGQRATLPEPAVSVVIMIMIAHSNYTHSNSNNVMKTHVVMNIVVRIIVSNIPASNGRARLAHRRRTGPGPACICGSRKRSEHRKRSGVQGCGV